MKCASSAWPRARQLEIPAIVEMAQPVVRARQRRVVLVGEQQLADIAVASGQRDQAVAVSGEPVRIDQGMIAVPALDVGCAKSAARD